MTEHKFEIKFGKSWRKYARALRETAPAVIEAFKGTSLEENIQEFYESTLPKKRESPIRFLLRNGKLSYATNSPYHSRRILANEVIAKIGWCSRKIPLLRKILSLEGLSTELYIGQKTGGYVSKDGLKNAKGYGSFRTVVSNLAKPMNIDFDVGFSTEKNKRNYFLKINVYDDSLLPAAQSVYDIIKKYAEK